jgi:predicted CXXCH cytochrome family protein
MIERNAGILCATIGVFLLLSVNVAVAQLPLSAGDSCASISCHTDKFEGTGAHDDGSEGQFCVACHVIDDPDRHAFRLPSRTGRFCLDCHADLTEHEHRHAPAEAGLCTFCHGAHETQYAGLLRFPAEALCVTCHTDTVPTAARTVHGPVVQGNCTACHDPHGSANAAQLIATVPEVCFTCHNQDQTDHQGRRLPAVEPTFVDRSLSRHPPFARGDCLLCHNPHASENYRLQRRPYSQAFYTEFSTDAYFCLMCHGEATFIEARTLTSTKFRNGNLNLHYRHVVREKGRGCRACHHQHASRLEAQIATATALGDQDIGIKAFAKTETGGSCEPSCHRTVQYDRLRPVNNGLMVTEREGVDASADELRQAAKVRDGATLYLQRCAGCHGADAGGRIGPPIGGATVERVLAATERVDLMADLATLDRADLDAIVESLPAGAPPVAASEGVSDGTVLYSRNCASCHGADANGRVGPTIRGADSAEIRRAIGRVSMMVAMKALNAESVDAIGEYLASLGEASADAVTAADAPDGPVIYSMYCLGCHGGNAEGQIGPSIRGVSEQDIYDAIGRVPMMAGLRSLETAEIRAVHAYINSLVSGPPTAAEERAPAGEAVYISVCSACHGEDASGHIGPDIRGDTAADIENAIARTPLMFGLKTSSQDDIEAVAKYLQSLVREASITAESTTADGEALFKRHCAACHGPDGTGLVGPDITHASTDDITTAIEQVPMMIAMKVLGSKDIRATADYLGRIRQSIPTRVDE